MLFLRLWSVFLARLIYISYSVHIEFGQHLEAPLEADPVETLQLTRRLINLEAISLWTWALSKLSGTLL